MLGQVANVLHRCTACCTSVPPIRFVLVGAVLGKAAATAALQIGASVFYRSHRTGARYISARVTSVSVRVCVLGGVCGWDWRGHGAAQVKRRKAMLLGVISEVHPHALARQSAARSLARLRRHAPVHARHADAPAARARRVSHPVREVGPCRCRQFLVRMSVCVGFMPRVHGRMDLRSCTHARMRAAACAACTQSPAALTHVCLRRQPARPPVSLALSEHVRLHRALALRLIGRGIHSRVSRAASV